MNLVGSPPVSRGILATTVRLVNGEAQSIPIATATRVPFTATRVEQARQRAALAALIGGDMYGPVETRTRCDVEALITAHPMGEALAEIAYSLAHTLDEGAGVSTAAVARELRATLLEMSRLGVDGDDDLDSRLSTPKLPPAVRDPEDT